MDLDRICQNHNLDLLKTVFNFGLGPLVPTGVPGEGPDTHFPEEIMGLVPIPARIRGVIYFEF